MGLGLLEDGKEIGGGSVLKADDLLIGDEASSCDKILGLVVLCAARGDDSPPVVVVHMRIHGHLVAVRVGIVIFMRVQERLARSLVAQDDQRCLGYICGTVIF